MMALEHLAKAAHALRQLGHQAEPREPTRLLEFTPNELLWPTKFVEAE